MAVKVAINGFGRIGRLAFRQMFDAEGYEVVAINDLTSPEMLAHLLKYDTAQGRYKYADSVSFGEDSITVNGKKITIYKESDAKNLPWGKLDVDVVLECTGFYTSKEKASAHITAGAQNIVPNSTGAAKAIGLVIPELNGKLIGAAQRVPTPTGSTTILIAKVAKKVTKEEINEAMKKAATESFGYNTDEIVSSDVIGMTYGSLFDATQTMVGEGNLVQVVSWYDNENSYVSQMVRTIKYFAELA
jgi:glyceraldehyde 3-phosphate dehydrogenase